MSVQIYTSYFKKIPFIKQIGYQPVAICQFVPSNFDGPEFKLLAPSKEILEDYKNTLDWIKYKDRFYAELLNKNIYLIAEGLRIISQRTNNINLVLCCYEEPGRPCHRHIVADFFNEWNILGGNVKELSGDNIPSNSIELF